MISIGLVIPTWTPNIKGENSVSELKEVLINGTDLTVMIRGKNRNNPVIIFVHGGPGCSEIPYVRKYQDKLEENFTIVHYDQRGSGKSYHFFEDYSNITADMHVKDLLSLTDYVTKVFKQEKVLLIGHSYGTYIGMLAAQAAPDKFYAYIGIGQVSDATASELDSLEFVLTEAKKANHTKDIKRLETLRDSIKNGEELTPRNLVRKYGGASRLIDENKDYYSGFLFNPEYNLLDVIRYLRGISSTQEKLLEEKRKRNIVSQITRLEIPAYFVMGKYDYMTSTKAAKIYFEALEAPFKQFVTFDRSAHYPQFEEEERFFNWLSAIWKKEVLDP